MDLRQISYKSLLLILCLHILFSSLTVFGQVTSVNTLIEKYHLSKSQQDLYLAYSEVEKIKSNQLQNLLLSCLPDSEVSQILSLKNQYIQLLSDVEQHPEDETFIAKQDSFKEAISKKFPQCFFFILAQEPIKISEVQKKYLKNEDAILNYYIADDWINIFVIKKDTFDVVRTNTEAELLEKQIHVLTNQLLMNKNPLNLEFDINIASQLYELLLKPVENYFENIHAIIIIPDRYLFGFPLECLISGKSEKINHRKTSALYHNFTEYNFLIQKYAIAYNYTTSWFYMPSYSTKKLGRKLLAISEIKVDPSMQADSLTTGWSNHSPYYSHQEVEHVSRIMWRHEKISGNDATKTFFQNNCYYYRWIYLSIPGFLNNENYKESSLVFSSKDSSGSKLMLSELFYNQLRADLITLTGCELKPVDVTSKIGVIGIPHILNIIGAQSVIFNLWRINDITVSNFISKFYWELKYKRQTNIFALQQAKIASIKDTFEYNGQEISKAHPYFWASFVLIGKIDIRPPTFSTVPPKAVIIIMYVIVITVAIIIVRKTLEKKIKE